MSPLLIHKANVQDLAMQIRNAANKALRAARKGASLEANFEDNMRPVLQDAAKRLGVENGLSSQVKVIGAGRKGGTGKADLVFSNRRPLLAECSARLVESVARWGTSRTNKFALIRRSRSAKRVYWT